MLRVDSLTQFGCVGVIVPTNSWILPAPGCGERPCFPCCHRWQPVSTDVIHTHLFTRAILPTRIVSSINKRQAAPALSLGETPGKEEFKTTTMTTSPNPQPVGWLTYIENSPVKTGALIRIQQKIFQQKRNFLPCPAVSYTQEGICHQFLGLKNNNLRDNRRGGLLWHPFGETPTKSHEIVQIALLL